MARGNWNIHKGIKKRWAERSLDDRFRDFWTNPARLDYPPLMREEARPNPPGPYCVYVLGTGAGTVQQRSGGKTARTENQYLSIPLTFTIHAKTRGYSGGTKSGDEVAEILAGHVADAFDPGAGILDLGDDKHIYTYRNTDDDAREDDDEWSWSLLYDLYIDAEFDRMPIVS